ncbi:hypothetical protein J5N97_020834 [Dioscorea zingiberensis]|uniref:Uncharacterized protein n=1 Tax=Dioscorea zingiberensis TaxID=325984 RepID=A0A9D5CH82_9LILI|nr:hypothetical protein J5N97_020834 [Dioscorea zingiberensis]
MAAPHVAGIMALIKKKHPTWSPAAIQSAIITTAKDMDLDGKPMVDNKNGKPASIFAKGAGLVNPSGAMDPGLVYDRNISDYKGYMCGLGYSSSNVELIIRKHVNCTKVKKIKASQLNYASIMVTLSNISPNETVQRTVTNVGDANSEYNARVVHPVGANITLSPDKLQFSKHNQPMSFNITISMVAPAQVPGKISEGKLEWLSKKHVVRSPIAVIFG